MMMIMVIMVIMMMVICGSHAKPLVMTAGQQKEAVLAKPPHLKVRPEEFLSLMMKML